MLYGGTKSLFDRVANIATALEKAGEKDFASNALTHTVSYIAEEAARQRELYETDRSDLPETPISPSAFGNQISYLHNEFNFDSARPIHDFALITHVSFVPVFPPRIADKNAAMQGADDNTKAFLNELPSELHLILQNLREEAIHSKDPPGGVEDFRGGRDDITRRIYRFLVFDQPVITTMRSIRRIHRELRAHFDGSVEMATRNSAHWAHAWNRQIDREVAASGMSSRASMFREYMLLMSAQGTSQLRLTWVRHHSHYQTLTAVEQVVGKGLAQGAQFDLESRSAAPTLCALGDALRDSAKRTALRLDSDNGSLLDRTAFDAFPSHWANFLFGRYLQGANYLILPLSWLFENEHLADCMAYRPPDGFTLPKWDDVCRDACRICGVELGSEPLTAAVFRQIWFAAQHDPSKLRVVSDLALRLLKPLIEILFPSSPHEHGFEFVMCGAAHGGALILCDVRNFGRPEPRALMSATLIVDIGMNDFERGRLLKNLTDFSTERFLALSSLGTFRFFNDALDVLAARLNRSANVWLQDNARTSGLSTGGASRDARLKDQAFIEVLQYLMKNLTMLNNLVDNGIGAHSASAEASLERVMAKMGAIGHYELPGFMSFKGFLDRRFTKSVRTISSVGKRYSLLRQRIAELSALVEAKVQIDQNESQNNLLEKVDRLTLFGFTYYMGQIIAYCYGFYLFMTIDMKAAKNSYYYAMFIAYPLIVLFAILIGKDVARTFMKEILHSEWFAAQTTEKLTDAMIRLYQPKR